MTPNGAIPPRVLRTTAMRVTCGAICLSSSSHFTAKPYSGAAKPVVLPLGRARLATVPAPTGSFCPMNTIGSVRVAICNARTLGPPLEKITSGASATNSAACLRARSSSTAPQRYSISTLRPTAQPNSCSPCRNPAIASDDCGSSAATSMSTPMRRTRSRCCALAARGHAAAAPPRKVMNSRRCRVAVIRLPHR